MHETPSCTACRAATILCGDRVLTARTADGDTIVDEDEVAVIRCTNARCNLRVILEPAA